MFSYYAELALRSFRRSPGLTALMVLAIGFGVAASMKTFAVFRADIGMAALMGGISLILLCVTAAGIFGLTSFWVDQRERRIGIRRALGARRRDILGYFQVENLLIVGSGAVLGTALAIALNLTLIPRYEMDRLPITDVFLGVVLVLVLSQVSTFVPARRAARVEPASAIRSM